MRRLLPLLSALMLVLVLWSGTGAHAAEMMECNEVASSSDAGHFEGDGDQVPADSDKGTPHHHSACHGHCVAIPSGLGATTTYDEVREPLSMAAHDLHLGAVPDLTLRPPIA